MMNFSLVLLKIHLSG